MHRSVRYIAVAIFLTSATLVVAPGCKNAAPTAAPPVPEVMVADVIQQDVTLYGDWVGTTEGFVNADIYPKISGFLIKQNYRDGDAVQARQLLFQIDPPISGRPRSGARQPCASASAAEQNQQNLARYTIL